MSNFKYSENKDRICNNITNLYGSDSLQQAIVKSDIVVGSPLEHQQLIKSQIANSFNTKNVLSSEELEKSADDFLEKGGKRAVIGERRTFGGREYIKTKDGWKFHGKGGGVKATAHREGALDHHVESGKVPVDHNKEAEKWANELHTPTKLSHGMTMTQIDEKHAHHSRQAQLAAGTHPSQKKEEPGVVGKPDTITLDKDHKDKKNGYLDHKDEDVAKHHGFDVQEYRALHPQTKDKLAADMVADKKFNAAPKEEGLVKQPASKHIADMSATEMKAAADKLGIDVKGKSVKQVRKELTDTNIDKQIAEFKAKSSEKKVIRNSIEEIESEIKQLRDRQDKIPSRRLAPGGGRYSSTTKEGKEDDANDMKRSKLQDKIETLHRKLGKMNEGK